MEATYDSDTGGLSVITEGIHGLTLLVYVLGAIFVIVTVGIVCNKMIAKERKDYGIYKSMGFTSMNIRLLLSLRFAVASLIGALVGILLDVVLSQSISNVIFGYFGIYHYDSERLFRVMAIPVLFMVVIFTVFAFLRAGKVIPLRIRSGFRPVWQCGLRSKPQCLVPLIFRVPAGRIFRLRCRLRQSLREPCGSSG